MNFHVKRVVFTAINNAELLDEDHDVAIEPRMVVVKNEVSTISCGTERANLTGDLNVHGAGPADPYPIYPRYPGYSSAGTVVAVGSEVTSVKPGDKVACYWSDHASYSFLDESRVVKLIDGISLEEAAICHVCNFPLEAVHKVKVCVGETGMVMGLGILGQMAVQYLHAAGAVPVVAVDPVEERRNMALRLGADYAFSPFEENFAEKVKAVTGGGVNAAIEVTGMGAGLDETLDCMAKYGRVALLGCTRDKNFTIDYYRKVHCPGVSLIGAHTNSRPEYESHSGLFTHRDDIAMTMRLCAGGRIHLKELICETHSPIECHDIYYRLATDRNFPVCVQFDWRLLD